MIDSDIDAGVGAHVSHAFNQLPHLWDPSRTIGGWFTEPAGVWFQFVRPARGTDELSEWLTGPAIETVLQRFPGQRLLVVCDFRWMHGRALSARARLLQTAPILNKVIEKIILIPSLSATASQRQSMTAGAKLLRCFGIPVELESSVALVQHQLGLRARD